MTPNSLAAGNDKAPLRGFGAGTVDERRAAADSRRTALNIARPFVEAAALQGADVLLRALTADKLPDFNEMLDIRAGLRAYTAQLRAIDGEIHLAAMLMAPDEGESHVTRNE